MVFALAFGALLARPVFADEPPPAPPASAAASASASRRQQPARPPAPPTPPPASPASSPALPPWEKIGDSDGITAYRREVPGSPLIAVKGEGIVNASIIRVASVLVDTSRATEWIDRLVESRVVRQVSETETIHYDHIGTPIVMKDRDFVTRAKLEFDGASKSVILNMSPRPIRWRPPLTTFAARSCRAISS